MNKRLNLLYEWIGPQGPLTNKRPPTIYDFANSQHDCNVTAPLINGTKPIYYEIIQSLTTKNLIKLCTPSEVTNDTKFIYEIEWTPGNPDFETFFVPGAGILDRISINSRVLDGIRSGNGYLCISTIYESFLEDYVFHKIHHYFKVNNISLYKVIYLTNCINGEEIYNNFCHRHGEVPLLNIEYAGVWMKALRVQSGLPELRAINYKVGLKNKMFLQFNRRYREQRFIFLMNLHKRDLLKDFHISFSDIQPEGNDPFHSVATQLNSKHNIGLATNQIDELTGKLPLILDTPDFSKFPMESSLSDTIQFYNDSLIHVIAETNFYTDIIHITEKTLKPIMYKQPFIFVGPRHSIRYLKNMGFKTFGDLWDESYDEEEDHNKRMNMVLDLLQKLSNLSNSEKFAISGICFSIVNHNYNLLQDKHWEELTNLVEKYGE